MEAARRTRRPGPQAAPTAGNDSRQKITFTGHILAAILSLRFALPARAIAALLGCDRSTISHELPAPANSWIYLAISGTPLSTPTTQCSE